MCVWGAGGRGHGPRRRMRRAAGQLGKVQCAVQVLVDTQSSSGPCRPRIVANLRYRTHNKIPCTYGQTVARASPAATGVTSD
jgi:hypothetical protein